MKKKYTQEQREDILAIDLIHGGNSNKTAYLTKTSPTTIESWKQKYSTTILASIRQKKFIEFIEKAWNLAEKSLDQLEIKLEVASPRDTAYIYSTIMGKILDCANLFKVQEEIKSRPLQTYSKMELEDYIKALKEILKKESPPKPE